MEHFGLTTIHDPVARGTGLRPPGPHRETREGVCKLPGHRAMILEDFKVGRSGENGENIRHLKKSIVVFTVLKSSPRDDSEKLKTTN